MSKLGLMDKSHTPWESDRHDIVWQVRGTWHLQRGLCTTPTLPPPCTPRLVLHGTCCVG